MIQMKQIKHTDECSGNNLTFYGQFITLCDNKGVSPSAVVQAIGLNKSNATFWKNGSLPSSTNMKKLAEYFGVSADCLIRTKNENTTGARIRTARKNAGLTQKQLAEKLNITAQRVHEYEKNAVSPKIDRLREIAQILEVPTTSLLQNCDIGGNTQMNELEKRAQKALDVIDGETVMNKIFDKILLEMGEPVAVNRFYNDYILTDEMDDAYSDATLACEKVGFYYGFRAAVKLIKTLDPFDVEVSK